MHTHKHTQTHTQAYQDTIVPMSSEREDLVSESEMITEIMKLIQDMTNKAATKAQQMAKLAQISSKINRIINDKKLPASLRAQALKMTQITSSLEVYIYMYIYVQIYMYIYVSIYR
jgi:hypothetical protein